MDVFRDSFPDFSPDEYGVRGQLDVPNGLMILRVKQNPIARLDEEMPIPELIDIGQNRGTFRSELRELLDLYSHEVLLIDLEFERTVFHFNIANLLLQLRYEVAGTAQIIAVAGTVGPASMNWHIWHSVNQVRIPFNGWFLDRPEEPVLTIEALEGLLDQSKRSDKDLG